MGVRGRTGERARDEDEDGELDLDRAPEISPTLDLSHRAA